MEYKDWGMYTQLEEAVNNSNSNVLQRLSIDELERLSNEYDSYYICKSRQAPTNLNDFQPGEDFQYLINHFERGRCGGMCTVNMGGRRQYFIWNNKPYFWFQPDEFADMYC